MKLGLFVGTYNRILGLFSARAMRKAHSLGEICPRLLDTAGRKSFSPAQVDVKHGTTMALGVDRAAGRSAGPECGSCATCLLRPSGAALGMAAGDRWSAGITMSHRLLSAEFTLRLKRRLLFTVPERSRSG